MKKLEAYIQPFMLQRVLKELRAAHVHGMTVTDVRGFGREKDESYPHHSADYAIDFTPKIRVEVLARDEEVDDIVEAIARGAHTGRAGDGKVFVVDIAQAVSIRTGARGDEAI